LYFQEFTLEVHWIGFLVEKLLKELVRILHYRDALLVDNMQRTSSVYALLGSEWSDECFTMIRMVWDPNIMISIRTVV